MIMSKDAIEEFGKRLSCNARDGAISSCNLPLLPDRQTKDALRWRAAAAAAGGQVPASIVISESVDSAISAILWAIAQEILCLSWTTQRGVTLYLPVDGDVEMNGLYGCVPGWRTWYSQERVDDRYDLAHISAEYGVEDDSNDPAPNLDDLEMPRRAIEELGILLVRHVRDVAIQSCDMQLLPHSQTPTAKRWRRAAIPFNGQVPPQVLIPDCVDEAIFAFLRAIDQGLLPLSYVTENGETVDLVKEGRGQLAAMYMANDGWRAKYSKERINENVAN